MASPWWRWLSPGSAPRSLATLSFQLAGGVVAPGSAIAVLLIVRLALMVAAIANLRSPTRRASSGRVAAGFAVPAPAGPRCNPPRQLSISPAGPRADGGAAGADAAEPERRAA